MLRARPELAVQLRQRLQTSGLSPAQVRTRLKAAGYPESLLDQVMGAPSTDEASRAGPDSLIGAMRALGVVDSSDATVLRRMTLSAASGASARSADRDVAIGGASAGTRRSTQRHTA